MVFKKKRKHDVQIDESELPPLRYDGNFVPLRPENPDHVFNDYTAEEINSGANMRAFPSGADRDTDEGKPDYPGPLSWEVLGRYGEYMTEHGVRKDGTRRSASNWKQGMPKEEYLKSLFRHAIQAWALLDEVTNDQEGMCYEAEHELEEALCGVMFNAQGLLYERLNGR